MAITGDGTGLTYTPAANFAGTDTFTYTIADAAGLTDTATVTVTVTNVDNDAPDAVNDTATVAEDSGANPINVLANDTDPDPGDTRTITAVTQPANGTVAITGTAPCTYTPAANFAGTDTFTYTIADAAGLTDTATVTVTVTNRQRRPDRRGRAGTVAEDSTNVPVNLTTLTDDVDGDALTTDHHPPGQRHPDPHRHPRHLHLHPQRELHRPRLLHLHRHRPRRAHRHRHRVGHRHPRQRRPDRRRRRQDDQRRFALSFPATDLSVNDTDVDGTTPTVTAVSNPTGGTVSLTAGQITFTPTANYTGPAGFDYTLSDGALATDTGHVTITINPVNDAPTALDFAGTVAEDSTNIAVDLTTLTDDVDGDTLTYTITTTLANGTLTPTATPGVYTYTPNANFTGPDSFTYTVTDPGGLADTGTVSVTVTAVNDPPVAVDDTGITTRRTPRPSSRPRR